ncbi:hypothetical protein HID58_055793 [Brassica napus]|uniref:Mitochondrial transcription termination factor family protein n=1 Tax=Brassica napus TaxID=3708 RepID=A0ABQ8ALD9_BRANA|nr:hypothetical protein HID58_055793 [Brassica napus]
MYSLILHGRRSVELQKWRNLRVSLNILQNAFAFSNSFSSANVNPQGNTFTVSYLVESLGLTTKLAESISRKVTFEDKVNPDSVLNLLRSNGFEDSQISRIFPRFWKREWGNLSVCTMISSKTLCNKVSCLTLGQRTLKKVVDMGFDPTKSKFVEALHVVYEMSDKTIEEKVNVYKRLGFSEEDVWKIFKKWPFFLKFSEKKIAQTFETLKKCGLGFSRDEYKIMIKRFPQCFGYSAESLKKKFEFLVKKMKWPPEAVVLVPSVFGYSLEKRILPRCNVIKVLLSKGLIRGGNPPMSSVFVCTDEEFVSRYVMKQGKLVPELMAMLTGQRVS